MSKIYRAIGLMSGTSMDGIDLALIESDGGKIIRHCNFKYLPYGKDFKKRLEEIQHKESTLLEIKLLENELTLLHKNLVKEFLQENNIPTTTIDLIAFHGHTILHNPQQSITWQIGNANLLANSTNIDVISDFRSRDVAMGGQGAPLVPIYHFNLFSEYDQQPTAVLNIGGISNITFFPNNKENQMQAFDVCFGNAPFDDLVKEKLGIEFDNNGEIAKTGTIDYILADRILQNDLFHKKPVKSFDREDFSHVLAPITNLKIEDALATFSHIHAKALAINIAFLSKEPQTIFICGGGRKNRAIMDDLKKQLIGIEIKAVEEIGLNGDAIEAEAFAFLGIRYLLNLPISFHKTTGVKDSISATGGTIFKKCS